MVRCEKELFDKVARYKHTYHMVNYRMSKLQNPVIDDQTLQFWNLQLQFMEMDFATLIGMIDDLMVAELYVKTKKSKKIQRYVADLRNWGIIPDPNQKDCLATHLALQLSGLA